MRWAQGLGLCPGAMGDTLRDLQFLKIPPDCCMEKAVEAGRPVRKLLYHPWREIGGRDQEMAWGWEKGDQSQGYSGSKMDKT